MWGCWQVKEHIEGDLQLLQIIANTKVTNKTKVITLWNNGKEKTVEIHKFCYKVSLIGPESWRLQSESLYFSLKASRPEAASTGPISPSFTVKMVSRRAAFRLKLAVGVTTIRYDGCVAGSVSLIFEKKQVY